MWVTYNRKLSADNKYWEHPDFATDGRTSERYLSSTDNTLFLINTTVTDFTDYDAYNITEVAAGVLTATIKQFKTGLANGHYTKADFLTKMFYADELINYYDKCDPTRGGTIDDRVYLFDKMLNNLMENDINVNDTRIINAITYFGNTGILRTTARINEVLTGVEVV